MGLPGDDRERGSAVKKLLALAAAVAAIAVVKRKKGQQSTEVWRQATGSK